MGSPSPASLHAVLLTTAFMLAFDAAASPADVDRSASRAKAGVALERLAEGQRAAAISDVLRNQTYTAGFSPDGTRIAAQNGRRFFSFDPSSGEAVAEVALPGESPHDFWELKGWGHDVRLYFRHSAGRRRHEIVTLRADGTFAPAISLAGGAEDPHDALNEIVASAQSSNLFVADSMGRMALYDADGRKTGTTRTMFPGIFREENCRRSPRISRSSTVSSLILRARRLARLPAGMPATGMGRA